MDAGGDVIGVDAQLGQALQRVRGARPVDDGGGVLRRPQPLQRRQDLERPAVPSRLLDIRQAERGGDAEPRCDARAFEFDGREIVDEAAAVFFDLADADAGREVDSSDFELGFIDANNAGLARACHPRGDQKVPHGGRN